MITVRNASTSSDQVHLPAGIVLKPPVDFEEMAEDIEHDPEEAEALVELIRKLRREGAEFTSGQHVTGLDRH